MSTKRHGEHGDKGGHGMRVFWGRVFMSLGMTGAAIFLALDLTWASVGTAVFCTSMFVLSYRDFI